ncbi:MAG: DUF4435 domain-containing protein [bacterium]|nr:DUF4435 domain-containing protein [bacterium]
MAELSYSNDAENVLNKFYGVDTIVYVEGTDDVPFWEYIFEIFADYSVEINDVGGLPEVKKFINKIEAGEIKAVVACDADFSYSRHFSKHHNVLRSYGHSIENSMICQKTIKKVIRSIGRVPMRNIDDSNIANWFEKLADSTKDLVIHDIANHIRNEGKSVAGDNCSRFMKSSKSSEICPIKIEKHLADIDLKMTKRLENKIIKSIAESDRTEADFLRGHFLFSASLKYVISEIRKFGKKVAISNDSFFGALFIAFEAVFNSTHSHYNYYQNIVHKVEVNA